MFKDLYGNIEEEGNNVVPKPTPENPDSVPESSTPENSESTQEEPESTEESDIYVSGQQLKSLYGNTQEERNKVVPQSSTRVSESSVTSTEKPDFATKENPENSILQPESI